MRQHRRLTDEEIRAQIAAATRRGRRAARTEPRAAQAYYDAASGRVAGVFGTKRWMAQLLGQKGGQVSSEAKEAAARERPQGRAAAGVSHGWAGSHP